MKCHEWVSKRVYLRTAASACHCMPTVLAHVFCNDGFVIAADGLDHLRDGTTLTVDSDEAQKVFRLDGNNRSVACAFYGRVTQYEDSGENLVFDFISELNRASRMVASEVFPDAATFGTALAEEISDRLQRVIETGSINKYLAARKESRTLGQRGIEVVSIYLDGYFGNDPYRSHISIFKEYGTIMWQLGTGHPLSGNGLSLHGSDKIAYHLFDAQNDEYPHLATYRSKACRSVYRRPQLLNSLQDAMDVARNYVAACCDQRSRDVDPICHNFGGTPQLATITRQDGFQWVDPPGRYRILQQI